jgi:hypothetical protein
MAAAGPPIEAYRNGHQQRFLTAIFLNRWGTSEAVLELVCISSGS